MVRLVEAAAIEIVAHALRDPEAERKLRRLAKGLAQAAIIRRGLLRNRPHQRQQLAPQRLEQFLHRGGRHALLGIIDERVGDVLVGREELRVFAADIEDLLQERHHGGKVIGRPRPRPGVIRGGPKHGRAYHVFRRHLDCLFEVALHHAKQSSVVLGQARSLGRQCIDQAAKRRIDELLMREPLQGRALAPACGGALFRHVGGLVPG